MIIRERKCKIITGRTEEIFCYTNVDLSQTSTLISTAAAEYKFSTCLIYLATAELSGSHPSRIFGLPDFQAVELAEYFDGSKLFRLQG